MPGTGPGTMESGFSEYHRRRAGSRLVAGSEGPLKDEVAGRAGADSGHLDLEIGDAVAVGIAEEQAAREAEFAGRPAEDRAADEVEGLVAGGGGIGVDGLQVDPVVLGMTEALEQIVVGADPAFGDG